MRPAGRDCGPRGRLTVRGPMRRSTGAPGRAGHTARHAIVWPEAWRGARWADTMWCTNLPAERGGAPRRVPMSRPQRTAARLHATASSRPRSGRSGAMSVSASPTGRIASTPAVGMLIAKWTPAALLAASRSRERTWHPGTARRFAVDGHRSRRRLPQLQRMVVGRRR